MKKIFLLQLIIYVDEACSCNACMRRKKLIVRYNAEYNFHSWPLRYLQIEHSHGILKESDWYC